MGKQRYDGLVAEIAKFPLVACCCLFSFLATAAPPELTYLYPAGGQRGETVKVTAAGAFANWPPEVWVDREGIDVTAAEEKNHLKFSINKDAEAGVYWLRLHDREGATRLRPFIVGNLPEVIEAEPNDDPTRPQALESSAVTVNGKLEKRGDVDSFAVTLAAGQTVIASLEAHATLASPMDGLLQVTNAEGFVLMQNDDARGFDPLLVFKAPQEGTYIVRTFAFPATPNSTIGFAGGENFVYRLTLTTGGLLDHTMPLAVNAGEPAEVELVGWNIPVAARWVEFRTDITTEQATLGHQQVAGTMRLPVVDVPVVVEHAEQSPQRITSPAVISGTISAHGEVDQYIIPAAKGQKLSLKLESQSLGFPLDAVLQITDGEGKVLKEVDDISKQADPQLEFTPTADGSLTIRVFDLHRRGGLRYAYRLTVGPPQVDYELTLATGEFVVTPATPLEIPITINRTGAFAEPIEITAQLPAGLSAEPATSQPKGDTAKSVKLIINATGEAASGPITIEGRSTETKIDHRARFKIGESKFTHDQPWVTATGEPDKE